MFSYMSMVAIKIGTDSEKHCSLALCHVNFRSYIIVFSFYQGDTGERGDKGLDGVPGAPGLPGEAGRDGLMGLKGEKVWSAWTFKSGSLSLWGTGVWLFSTGDTHVGDAIDATGSTLVEEMFSVVQK